ncbi:dipeptidase [Arcanobacterium bovis]|uniref:Dipeptidase n=1 Tax=Arcanobacterium bovis TaxID=2529275 RepID=A0A4Q9V193_9ACTO|nr:dipeptidase [Arcanobacterium bovis]TBW22825.1 dipeptidase [Arcanobacterium bovis]
MNTESIVSRVNTIFDKTKADLIDLVAIPSVSAASFDQAELDRSAEWIAGKARALGLDTQVIKIETESGLVGRPAILATRPAEPGKPTVLLYAHHDVQPPGKSELWDSEPFLAQERDGRLYGRGAADDKAGVLLHLAAIEAADPGVGITLFIEGEEEVGSPTFVDFLNTYKDTLKSDVIVVADSNNWKVGVPSLTTSLRGVCQLDVNISVLDHALHSGMYSGPTLDAVTIAARLISTLHNDAGEVVVEGLEQRDDTSVDYPEADLRKDMGLLDGIELAGTGSLTSRLWTKPTITVIGMDVTPTDIASNTLIPAVKMTLSMRVAPGQDSREAAEALEKHLLSHVPFNAHINVQLNEAGPSFQAKTASAATDLAKWALRTAWDVEPVDIGVGGSIPFISDLAEVFPDAEILVTGVEDPDTRAHSENESLHLDDWKKAIIAESLMLSRLGE